LEAGNQNTPVLLDFTLKASESAITVKERFEAGLPRLTNELFLGRRGFF
jgi:hypothetical protein